MNKCNFSVGVKYCGHCNPQKNGESIIEDLLHVFPELVVASWSEPKCDVILIISACPVGCASPPKTDKAWINVAMNQVRNWFVPQNHPAQQLLNAFKILGYEFVSTN